MTQVHHVRISFKRSPWLMPALHVWFILSLFIPRAWAWKVEYWMLMQGTWHAVTKGNQT